MAVCLSCKEGGSEIGQALDAQHSDCLLDMLMFNFNEENELESTPLHAAIIESDCHPRSMEVIKFLLTLPNISVEERDNLGRTPLLVAAGSGELETMKALVENYNADLQAKDFKGQNALHWAIKTWEWYGGEYEPSPEKVEYLLQAGCRVNERDEDHRTPLLTLVSFTKFHDYRFIQEDYVQIATMLLDYGAEVNVTADGGLNVLAEAAERSQPELLQLILERGAESNGVLPMMCVLQNLPQFVQEKDMQGLDDTVRSVRVLLEHECDFPEEVNGIQGVLNFVFSVAFEDFSEECAEPLQDIIKFLAEGGADPAILHDQHPPLQMACLLGWEWCVPSLISPASVNQRGMEGQTALHIAARKNQTEIVRWLLEKGANRGSKDNFGETPLAKAINCGCTESAVALSKWKNKETTRKRKAELRNGTSKWSRE